MCIATEKEFFFLLWLFENCQRTFDIHIYTLMQFINDLIGLFLLFANSSEKRPISSIQFYSFTKMHSTQENCYFLNKFANRRKKISNYLYFNYIVVMGWTHEKNEADRSFLEIWNRSLDIHKYFLILTQAHFANHLASSQNSNYYFN